MAAAPDDPDTPAPDTARRPTLHDVARAARVALATASYALRGSAKIPPATTERVRAAAARLGYRPNPRFAELMSAVRRGGPLASGERLALVWPEGARGAFARLVADGARSRAEARGYALEEFRASAFRRPARLAEILAARGIGGVVFGPVTTRDRFTLDWPWERFAMAVIGSAELGAPLSRAAHHHYEAMRLTLAALTRRADLRRPAALLEAATNERAHRGWQAAWLAYAGTDAAARIHLLPPAGTTAAGRALVSWWRRTEPDALVVSGPDVLDALAQAGLAAPPAATFTLARAPGDTLPGIAQGYDVIAAHAVDLVIAQLQRNERGLPTPPRSLLFPGEWRES
jgi:LacI family transcriptional regulator